MPRENGQRGNDATANALRQAFLRLKDGRPRNPGLRALNREGQLNFTVRNVAIEADVSRTLIAHKDCDYPEIREEVILEIQRIKERRRAGEEIGPTKGLDSQTVIERLREKIIDLRLENGILFTKLAEAVSAARDLEERLSKVTEDTVDDSPRARRIAARNAKAAKGGTPPAQGHEATVIRMHLPDSR